jgi:hypothetical protein
MHIHCYPWCCRARRSKLVGKLRRRLGGFAERKKKAAEEAGGFAERKKKAAEEAGGFAERKKKAARHAWSCLIFTWWGLGWRKYSPWPFFDCFGKHVSNAVFQGQIGDTWRRVTREPPVTNLFTFYERSLFLELAITVTLQALSRYRKVQESQSFRNLIKACHITMVCHDGTVAGRGVVNRISAQVW